MPVFNDVFLDSVRKRGRVYELGLMAAYKLRTRRLFEDVGKVPMMLSKGKLPLLRPRVGGRGERKAHVRSRRRRRRRQEGDHELRLLPGLLAGRHGQGLPPLHAGGGGQGWAWSCPRSQDWICCGSTAAHSTDPLLAVALPAKNLLAAGGQTVAVACAACYSRLKMANHQIAGDPAVRARGRRGGRQRLRRPDAGAPPAGDPGPRTSGAGGSPQASRRR